MKKKEAHDFYFEEALRHLCVLHMIYGINEREDKLMISRAVAMMSKQHPVIYEKVKAKLHEEGVVD